MNTTDSTDTTDTTDTMDTMDTLSTRRHTTARRGTDEALRFRTPVRGYRFAARPPGADHPRRGQGVLLHHEKGHPMDRWAVAIWTRSADGIPWRIGYLERAVAARIGPRLRGGVRVTGTVIGWMTEPDGRWRRPVIEVDAAPLADRSRKTA